MYYIILTFTITGSMPCPAQKLNCHDKSWAAPLTLMIDCLLRVCWLKAAGLFLIGYLFWGLFVFLQTLELHIYGTVLHCDILRCLSFFLTEVLLMQSFPETHCKLLFLYRNDGVCILYI